MRRSRRQPADAMDYDFKMHHGQLETALKIFSWVEPNLIFNMERTPDIV
jgi:hypothetical protein